MLLISRGTRSVFYCTGTVVSYNDYARLYQIFHIDVSKRDLQIYELQITTEISVQYKLRTTQTEIIMYIVLFNLKGKQCYKHWIENFLLHYKMLKIKLQLNKSNGLVYYNILHLYYCIYFFYQFFTS
jgi:hypothetical protein